MGWSVLKCRTPHPHAVDLEDGSCSVQVPAYKMSECTFLFGMGDDAQAKQALLDALDFSDSHTRACGWSEAKLHLQFVGANKAELLSKKKSGAAAFRLTTLIQTAVLPLLEAPQFCTCGFYQCANFFKMMETGDRKFTSTASQDQFHRFECRQRHNKLHLDRSTAVHGLHRESDMAIYTGAGLNRFSASAMKAAVFYGTNFALGCVAHLMADILAVQDAPEGQLPDPYLIAEAGSVDKYEYPDAEELDLMAQLVELELKMNEYN